MLMHPNPSSETVNFPSCRVFIFVSPRLRLAVDHSLRALTVPGSLHRDLGCGALNLAKISFAELDRCCRDVLLQPMQFRRPRNGYDPWLPGKDPRRAQSERVLPSCAE